MAEKEIVIEYGGRSYGKAAIQDLLQRVDAMRTSGEEMGKEIASLKRQIGGLKTSNANYRKQVEQLKGQVEHYKGLDIEGDELYEKKIAECEELQKQLDIANLTIGELRGQIASYNNQILEYKDRIESLKEENESLREAIAYEQKPWWKKIF
jgi:chromosome segregation ATPase